MRGRCNEFVENSRNDMRSRRKSKPVIIDIECEISMIIAI